MSQITVPAHGQLRENAIGTAEVVFTSIANQSPGTGAAFNFSSLLSEVTHAIGRGTTSDASRE